MKLKNFEVKEYLNAWLYNVGFSRYGVERTLMNAMREKVSIRDWFGVDEVDYDEVFALKYLRDVHKSK
jgi:hypothetical protein